MGIEKLNNGKVKSFKEFIPSEFEADIITGKLKAIGGYFADDKAGALVYEVVEDKVVIKSIYVLPPFRRLGVGTELYEALPEGEIMLSYEALGDRATLEPFFEAMDLDLLRVDVPFADFTLLGASKALKKLDALKVDEKGQFLDDLKPDKEDIVMEWFERTFDERGLENGVYDSSSVFYIEDNEVKGAIFIHQDDVSDYDIVLNGPDTPPDELFAIDYLFCVSSNKKVLPGMMNKLLKRLMDEHRNTTRVQGMLTTEEGRKIYESMFGEPEISIPMFYGFG